MVLPKETCETAIMASNSSFLPFHLPDIGEEEIDSVVQTLRSAWLTTGWKVKQFEEDFARYTGASHAVAVNSGTAALHLALEAIGIHEGDEVIVPTMTFTATAEVVIYFKAKPVLVDCESDTLNLDAAQIESKITPNTKAIIPVHLGGQPCDMSKIMAVARQYRLKVIEDAAHALPARYCDKMVGTIGDITCFSFYATKTIATGEGGMATTERAEWSDRMRMMSLHGISKDAWKRYSSEGSWYYEVNFPGFKYNLTDIAAALGIEQLKKCDRFWQARKRIAQIYDDAFAEVPEVQTPMSRPNVQNAWHLYVIQLDLQRLRINRNEFIEALKKDHVGTSVHFIPLHLHPYYRDNFKYRSEDFPRATAAFDRIISLPIYPRMTREDVRRVIAAVKKIVSQYRR
ncbi:MAG: DegT/DnrJ/EryC1/StrS family aminotransferase [Candidatus Binatia bacterium]